VSHRPEQTKKEKKQELSDEEKNYKCTLLINYIRHNEFASPESMVLTLSYLVAHGASFDVTDSKGLSVMVYALKNNSEV
jgi:hypothetical protein